MFVDQESRREDRRFCTEGHEGHLHRPANTKFDYVTIKYAKYAYASDNVAVVAVGDILNGLTVGNRVPVGSPYNAGRF
jgi:hypothetical protein